MHACLVCLACLIELSVISSAACILPSLQAAIDAKQGMLDAATSELRHQQDRMRRGRYHVLQQEIAQARQGLEERMLAELERRLAHKIQKPAADGSGAASQADSTAAFDEAGTDGE